MKTILTTLLFISITTLAFSQETKFGVRVGTNISNMDYDGDPVNSNEHRNGFVFGAFGDFEFTDSFGVMVELQFSPEGSNNEEFDTDYLNLPVIAKYQFLNKLSIGVGPQVGLKIHKKDDGFKNFVFSGVGFAEFMITDELGVDARYIYGLSNVFDDELETIEAKAGVIQLGISYRL